MLTRSCTLTFAVGAALALATGCAPAQTSSATRTGDGAATRAAPSVAGSLALPRAVTLVETRAPGFDVEDLSLPAGCEVTDNTDTLAAYSQNTLQPYPSSVLGLLDLATGRLRVVLPQPVGSGRSFDAFTPMLSDDWVAWEEVSPGEANAMRSAEWRLYAARIDRATLTIGRPILVDEGTTDYKLRPHYGIEGSLLCWSVNTVRSPRQEYVPTSGSVASLDLATGERRTLYRGPCALLALKTSGPYVVVVEDRDRTPGSDRADAAGYRAVVLDARSGARVLAYDLGTRLRPAHFADYADGWLAWAPFSAEGAEWPDLYLRLPAGQVKLAGLSSIDPVFFRRYLAYESVSTTRSAGGGVTGQLRQIWGVDLARPGERFRLVETTGDDGWWQTTRAGRAATTLVLWNDLGPWVEDQSHARTLVRVYRTLE